MTIKEWLKRYKKAWKEAEDVEKRLTDIRLKYSRPSAIIYSDMPKAHRHTDLSDFMEQIEKYENILIDKYEKCLGVEVEIYMAIDKLEDESERRVLREYYIDDKKWKDIADGFPCHERTVHRIHGRALIHMNQIVNCH